MSAIQFQSGGAADRGAGLPAPCSCAARRVPRSGDHGAVGFGPDGFRYGELGDGSCNSHQRLVGLALLRLQLVCAKAQSLGEDLELLEVFLWYSPVVL